VTVSPPQANSPDYEQLVKFLFKPFLSATETLAVNCEYTVERNRVWLRVAFASDDQSTAFGRGGRNIQAIRTVLQAAATGVGQSIHLDVYGSSSSSRYEESERTPEQGSENRPPRIAPTRKPPNGGGKERGGDSAGSPPPIRPRR
jgi:uncharacterized protein